MDTFGGLGLAGFQGRADYQTPLSRRPTYAPRLVPCGLGTASNSKTFSRRTSEIETLVQKTNPGVCGDSRFNPPAWEHTHGAHGVASNSVVKFQKPELQ